MCIFKQSKKKKSMHRNVTTKVQECLFNVLHRGISAGQMPKEREKKTTYQKVYERERERERERKKKNVSKRSDGATLA